MSEKRPNRRGRPYAKRHDDDHDDADGRNPSQTQRRRKAALSLAAFSSKKGHDRALQEYKKRKETTFHKNAMLLREYQRAMKQEGYDAGRGASRKRGRRAEDDAADEEAPGGKKGSADEEAPSADATSRKKRHRSDPLRRAREEAARRHTAREDAASQKEARQREESERQHRRKQRARKMMQRTKRGQPRMKNVIGDLLGKIQSDAGEGGHS